MRCLTGCHFEDSDESFKFLDQPSADQRAGCHTDQLTDPRADQLADSQTRIFH